MLTVVVSGVSVASGCHMCVVVPVSCGVHASL